MAEPGEGDDNEIHIWTLSLLPMWLAPISHRKKAPRIRMPAVP